MSLVELLEGLGLDDGLNPPLFSVYQTDDLVVVQTTNHRWLIDESMVNYHPSKRPNNVCLTRQDWENKQWVDVGEAIVSSYVVVPVIKVLVSMFH